VDRVLLSLLLLFVQACGHGTSMVATGARRPPAGACAPELYSCVDEANPDGVRSKGNSFNARIAALIARGEFAEARMLIAESLKIGTISQQVATQRLERIDKLCTKLGEIPASFQRVASHAQLRMAVKLIEQEPRLMAD
jgi:hypothetical protein